MTLPARACFSAADDPWIEVRNPHGYHRTGLRGLILDAHTIEDLAVAAAPAASAILRIATVLVARITGLDDPELNADAWNERRNELLCRANGFDATAVNTYFKKYSFDVFDPLRPWMQDPRLREQCAKPSGINTLVFGRPAGNNLAWLSPHHDQAAMPLPTGEALQHLLIHHYYGASGGCTPRTVGTFKCPRAAAGPLRGIVSFHPLGRTLYETLLAGVPKCTADEQSAPDYCPWEEPQLPDPQAPLRPATWPGRRLTGLNRHAVLLVPGDDASTVSNAYLTWSTQQPRLAATDPYLVVRTGTGRPPAAQPRRADADRAWWRELDSLLLAPDERRATRRPEVFDTLNDLPPHVRKSLRVRVHGFDQDAKTIQRRWYTAITPPLLAWSQEHDPARANRIAECCTAAEDTAFRLAFLTNQAWKETNHAAPSRKTPSWTATACGLYWQQAEAAFWHLLDTDTDAPARSTFATTAARALHAATASARFRHRAAARAIAAAVDALYRPPPHGPLTRGPLMPTAIEYRHHYTHFTTHVEEACTDPKARRILRQGRGRPVDDCHGMHRFLSVPTRGYGQRRVHYTVASLIAHVDPLDDARAAHAPNAEPASEPAATGNDTEPYEPAAWRERPNLGATLAHAVQTAGFNETRTDELLAVMVRLGDNQLHRRLPALTGRLVDAGLIPDWMVLLDDLAQRTHDQGRVATRWQDAFYRTLTPTCEETP
ncbi:type I-E CRISPR-associated protein Cse1/CasA [Streptomyces sp. NPDC059396]|uniref:type I-E CRISPR-associated protein Cse1/CasA n=1 Tax=Streptomyces sp. NPDC059396 TaxID=3346819 RepID=UPI0036B01C7F